MHCYMQLSVQQKTMPAIKIASYITSLGYSYVAIT